MVPARRLRISLPGLLVTLVVLVGLAWWGAAPDCGGGGFIMLCLPRGLTLLLPAWTLADATGETGGAVWWTVLAAGSLVTLALLLAVPYSLAAAAESRLGRHHKPA